MALKKFNEWREEKGIVNIVEKIKSKMNIDIAIEPKKSISEFLKDLDLDSEESIEENEIEGPNKVNYSKAEWCEVKGIGPKLAEKLVENGPFENIDEISGIQGVSEAVLERIAETNLFD